MDVIGKSLGFDPARDARRAEAAGYSGVRATDHMFGGVPPDEFVAVPHVFVTLAAAAVVTKRILLTQTMVAATFRHPVEVAQAIATLDRISSGRAELGLGAGWLEDEHHALGLGFGTPRERLDRVVEAAQICRMMFENHGRVDFDGRFFQAHVGFEWPATPHRPDIVLGAHGPHMLRRAAAVADRIDLLERRSSAGTCFDDLHSNDESHLSQRIEVVHEVNPTVLISATVNLHVIDEEARLVAELRAVAERAGCSSSAVERDLLRVTAHSEEALRRLRRLAALGIDRVNVRPVDDWTRAWLDDQLDIIRAMPTI
jgi:alkanesulfonate monooxygenase SsuD/methylene tetrahydromethanopterin reductase-like flavin-dependent oxidoreductase (luciferase family)